MRLWIALIALLTPLTAMAGTVTFRSGEHADFSRLVLDIPPGTDWSLNRLADDYVLSLGEGMSFDTSAAFDRIPRDRIAALETPPDTGELVVRLGCDCHAVAFLFAPGKLVIDVADGPAPPGSPFEVARDGATGEPGPDRPILPLVTPAPDRSAEAALLFAIPEPDPVGGDPALAGLAADLSRAVAAGLLDAPEVLPAEATPAAPEARPQEPPVSEVAARPGVNFITADVQETSARTPRPEPQRACLPVGF